MKDVLNKIFTPEALSVVVATVRRRLQPGRYELADDSGRLFQADSSAAWPPGSRVTVQSGRIVAAAGLSGKINHYEV
ncbi:MAG: hypothetical protein WC869_15790 [Phycisphaerae bacterium]